MSECRPSPPSSAREPEPPDDINTGSLDSPLIGSGFCQLQVERAIAASLESQTSLNMDEAALKASLRDAKILHEADLCKTQNNYHNGDITDASVLVLVKFPEGRSATSCRFTLFNTGRIRLTHEQVLATGSDLLADLLVNEKHQRRAKGAAAPLPDGVKYVLDLSPTTDETDYTIALQLLSIPFTVQLWHRSMAFGTSPLTVAGHDDVCTCLVPFDEPYPFITPPESMNSPYGNLCILDTKEWPLEENRRIDDFCMTRWAANTLRLFRSISMPPGQKDLVIDSAPRMWTLVGLFAKLKMTNYDILRNEVVAWFNADMNWSFVELFPEETLYIGLILQSPILTESAFRILVNERALELAGGQPRSQPKATLFGRRCSDFTGTARAEFISRMVEHASCAMAERYKNALDRLYGDDALDLLDVSKWQELRALDHIIPKDSRNTRTYPIREAYDRMMSRIRQMFRDSIERVIRCDGNHLPNGRINFVRSEQFFFLGLTVDQIEEKRAFSVPKRELLTTQSFIKVYDSLNRYQRALTPIIWHGLSAMAEDLSALVGRDKVLNSVNDFKTKFDQVRRGSVFLGHNMPVIGEVLDHGACSLLFHDITAKLKTYVRPLVARDVQGFHYTMNPHLILALNDHEMNFLRLADDESTFQTEAPETELGPSGPGPAFHTGQTIPSVSDLDFEKLTIQSLDDTSTIGRSLAAQDGFSTVYNRSRTLARSAAPSIASEQFTNDMSADYAGAEYEVPADHQACGQSVAHMVEQADDDDYDDDDDDDDDDDLLAVEDLDFGLDDESESGTVVSDDGTNQGDPDWADLAVDNCNSKKETARPVPPVQNDLENELSCSEDFDDSGFEVI